jgi:hypothetical protein
MMHASAIHPHIWLRVVRCHERTGRSNCPGKSSLDCPDNPGSIRAHLWVRSARSREHNNHPLTIDSDTGSHGVSDPSGQARGPFRRARRGRSRHGYLP